MPPQDRGRLLDTVERTTQPDPPPVESKAKALKLLDRIRCDDSDAERLTDPAEIDEAFNRGELSREHYQFIVKQFDDARTPEGALLAAQVRAFMLGFKPVVDPNSPDAVATAIEQTFQVEQALAARVKRMQERHQDPGDLFDPSKPDYIQTPFELVPPLISPGAPDETPTELAPATSPPADDGARPAVPSPNPGQVESEMPAPQRPQTDVPPEGGQDATYDPFERAAERIRNSVLRREEGSGTEVFNRIMSSYANAIPAWFNKGREVFGPPPAPAKPGFWSEEDEIRLQEFEQKKIEFAADTALLLLAPFRTEPGLGVGPKRPGPGKPGERRPPKVEGAPPAGATGTAKETTAPSAGGSNTAEQTASAEPASTRPQSTERLSATESARTLTSERAPASDADAAPAASGLTPAEHLAVNRAAGAAFERTTEARLMQRGLTVTPQIPMFALLYLVEHVPAKFIRFAELIKAPLGGVAVGKVEARGQHYCQWRGPAKRWCVVGPNGTMVREGVLTKEEAERDVSTRNTPTSMAFVTHPRM